MYTDGHGPGQTACAYAATRPNPTPCSSIYRRRARFFSWRRLGDRRCRTVAVRQVPRSSSDPSPATGTTRYAHPLGRRFLLWETEHPNPNLIFVFGSDLISVYACIICLPNSIVLQNYRVYIVYPCPLLGAPLVGWLFGGNTSSLWASFRNWIKLFSTFHTGGIHISASCVLDYQYWDTAN